jgi:hypothetical protein
MCPVGAVGSSSITETESMEKFRPTVFRRNGRKSRHQLQIDRENQIRMVPGILPDLSASEALDATRIYGVAGRPSPAPAAPAATVPGAPRLDHRGHAPRSILEEISRPPSRRSWEAADERAAPVAPGNRSAISWPCRATTARSSLKSPSDVKWFFRLPSVPPRRAGS